MMAVIVQPAIPYYCIVELTFHNMKDMFDLGANLGFGRVPGPFISGE